ncbi:11082_t:CDS:10 [Funneliformis mosseae]|uniref:11082_t:CDS:1 n=1 Tax=Funneliformis mosseae TaxID=27381 RepID=A0A9N9FCA1_FUNMO|nr:11082_t:CDS:10 [Funneliformis mosseae]
MTSTDKLHILVVGSGGREHAIAWKLSHSPRVERIYVAPGNGGTESGIDKVFNINISVSDFGSLTKFAKENNINLVIPGPEQPLVEGIELAFKKIGVSCFGPSPKASMMEGSKTFAKDFMKKHKIPTATYENFSEYEKARAYLESISYNASGLAGGKGVIIPTNNQEALNALKKIMVDKEFGSAGDEVVIEEFLEGQELSVLAFSDGYTIIPLPPAQDHKRIFDGDQGPNTGGMGCYCPTPIATPELIAQIQNTILQPTIDGMRHDGFPFVGMLFTGIMITNSGPRVLEYNIRFGDPETEVALPLLSDKSDLADIILACVERRLDSVHIETKPGFAATVIAASGGYPGNYSKGKNISFNNIPSDTLIFHAGTSIKDGKLVTSGGRVLAVTGIAPTLRNAKDNVMTYVSAGVSIDSGNSLVQKIKPYLKSTKRSGSDCEIGGFGGLFDLKTAGFDDPILVSTTDGVGTKLKIAQAMNLHDTIGAEPLFFLDYYACGKLEVDVAQTVVKSIAAGCCESGCALLGGETSEMPGVYNHGEYDLAGFAVGAVERGNVLPRISDIKVDDVLIGISSSGIHSNGFSLVRKIIDKHNFEYKSPCPWNPTISLGESLLIPTKIYVKQLLPVVKRGLVKAMAHITGGGFIDNIPRILPKDIGVIIDSNAWELPKVFKWLKENGNIPSDDLFRTFNCGIGMVLIVSCDDEIKVKKLLEEYESDVYTIGRVVTKQANNDKHVVIKGI